MIRTLLDDEPPRDARLYVVHGDAASGNLWIGGATGPHFGTPDGLIAAQRVGGAWVRHDRPNPPFAGSYYANGLMQAWALGAPAVFTASDLQRQSPGYTTAQNLAEWTGSAWSDVWTDGVTYLGGAGPSDLYAWPMQPTLYPFNAIDVPYLHWNGSAWSGLTYAATPLGLDNWVFGQGYSAGDFSLREAENFATVAPDGIAYVSGGYIRSSDLHRRNFIWALSAPGGTLTEVDQLSDEPLDANYGYYRALWATPDGWLLAIRQTLLGAYLYRWDRSGPVASWTSYPRPLDPLFNPYPPLHVHGLGADDHWVANGNLVSHWTLPFGYDQPGTRLPGPNPATVHRLWVESSTSVWAVGDAFTGTAWVGIVWHWAGPVSGWSVDTIITS